MWQKYVPIECRYCGDRRLAVATFSPVHQIAYMAIFFTVFGIGWFNQSQLFGVLLLFIAFGFWAWFVVMLVVRKTTPHFCTHCGTPGTVLYGPIGQTRHPMRDGIKPGTVQAAIAQSGPPPTPPSRQRPLKTARPQQ